MKSKILIKMKSKISKKQVLIECAKSVFLFSLVLMVGPKSVRTHVRRTDLQIEGFSALLSLLEDWIIFCTRYLTNFQTELWSSVEHHYPLTTQNPQETQQAYSSINFDLNELFTVIHRSTEHRTPSTVHHSQYPFASDFK